MLSKAELWTQIESLQGKDIVTPLIHKMNRIIQVTDEMVIIDDRCTYPNKDDIYYMYRMLNKNRKLSTENMPSYLTEKRISRISLGILTRAVPDVDVVREDSRIVLRLND